MRMYKFMYQFSSVQLLSCVWLFATPWTATCQASLSITKSQSLLRLMSIESVMSYNHLILWRPCLLPPSIFPNIRVFSKEWVLHIRLPKYWNFSNHQSFQWIFHIWSPLGLTGFISLLSKGLSRVFSNTTVQKHQSILQHSAFFIVQLSHPYVTTGKAVTLTIWTFASKVMSSAFYYAV